MTNVLEVWQTLHAACDAILDGNRELAQTMIVVNLFYVFGIFDTYAT